MKAKLLTLGLVLISWTAHAEESFFRDSNSPCKELRKDCLAAGFELGSKNPKNRLIGDCIRVAASGTNVINSITGKTVPALSQLQGKACLETIHRGSKPPLPPSRR